jgi:hypothetical protein
LSTLLKKVGGKTVVYNFVHIHPFPAYFFEKKSSRIEFVERILFLNFQQFSKRFITPSSSDKKATDELSIMIREFRLEIWNSILLIRQQRRVYKAVVLNLFELAVHKS